MQKTHKYTHQLGASQVLSWLNSDLMFSLRDLCQHVCAMALERWTLNILFQPELRLTLRQKFSFFTLKFTLD